jgi:hypothetical protein
VTFLVYQLFVPVDRLLRDVQWPARKVSHHLNVSVIKALIPHLDFDVTEKRWLVFIAGHCTYNQPHDLELQIEPP